MLRLVPRLYRWAAASAQASREDHELSLRQLGVISAIREGVSSPGQLARRLFVTPAVVTGLLDRLERRGYVRREADPEDRRRLRLALTESGLAVSDAVRQALAESLATELKSVSRAEMEVLDRALGLMERAVGALEARTPTSDEGPGEVDEV